METDDVKNSLGTFAPISLIMYFLATSMCSTESEGEAEATLAASSVRIVDRRDAVMVVPSS